MTVSTAYSGPQTSACDGSTTSFPVAFQYADKSGLVVELIDDASGTATTLTEGTDYTRSGDGMSAPSSITTLTAYPAGKSIRRSRATPRLQSLLAPPNSLPPAAQMERAWDRAVLAVQEIDADLGKVFATLLRTWQVPQDGSVDGKYPVVLPGAVLGWATGTGADAALRFDLAQPDGPKFLGYSAIENYPAGSIGRRLQQVLSPKDYPFLAQGNGVTDDTAALTAWINALNNMADATPWPIGGFLPGGFYKYTSALPKVSQSVTIYSDNARQGVLQPYGSFDALVFGGTSARVPNCGLVNVCIDGSHQTNGFGLVVDWTQNFYSRNVLISDGWNGVSFRQGGEAVFHGKMDRLRGTIGFKAVGYGGKVGGVDQPLRNGEPDKIDVLSLDWTIEGRYVPGTPATATLDGCIIDGWVHTIDCVQLRMLNCKSGLQTLNTANLDDKFKPSLIRGWVEAENTLNEGIYLRACDDVVLSSPFASSSGAASGIRFGDHAAGVTLISPTSRSHVEHGFRADLGAKRISLYDPLAILNGAAAAGIYDQTTSGVQIHGGRCGGGDSVLAETQSVGIAGTAATRAYAMDLSGNVTAPVSGGVFTRDCKGASANATATASLGASPASYTVGDLPESFAVANGAVSQIAVNGVPWFVTTNVGFTAPANSTVTITYTVAPTVRTTRI